MSETRDLIDMHYAAFNERDFSKASQIYSPDVVTVEPGSGRMEGPDAVVAHARVFLAGFPDARLEVLTVVDDGARVAIEGLFVGTNTGPLQTPNGELPATGRSLRLAFADLWESEAGRISRHQVYFDQMNFLGQLGLVPEPAQA
jgi:steroid delta-isomerase-like uncharacterized protein